MEAVENIEVTEEMKRQEAEMLGEEAEGQQEEETRQQEEARELAEAQRTGVVDMSSKKEEKKNQNYTHTFSKPVEILGKKYKTLTFRFEDLTGADIEAVEQEMQDMGKYALSPEISSIFQSMLAARAARVGSDEIRRLPVADYMKIKNKARDFLTGMGY